MEKGSYEIVLGDYVWANSTIDNILKNPEYCGDIVNFKTFKQFKNTTKNMEIYKDVHEPIASRENFEEVQRTFNSKPGKSRIIEKNIFAGFLKCADCRATLNSKTSFGYSEQENHYFSCKNFYAKKGYALSHITSERIF